MILKYCT